MLWKSSYYACIQLTYNGRAVENVQANAIPLARPTDKVLLNFLLIIFAKKPNINAKARNKIIAYPTINSWEISNKIEVDKEMIRNNLKILPAIQPFE